MTEAADPKHTTDQFGILGEPRFIPALPPRANGASERMDALRPLMDAVKARPDTWAAVAESDKRHPVDGIKAALKRGRFGPGWECAVRVNPDTKRHVVYVRWVPSQNAGQRRP